ncbi:hypothetical protein E8E13_001702 [Curvularia kusanoi]|uniref:Uncharacterized protein n=1 Tax=Curvularia kusanoi TaxID=90978 RepID=A0A9P4T3Z5_CURKU|nr:hypothetical protein E8E13_001702 [Curvularia kusanoi]
MARRDRRSPQQNNVDCTGRPECAGLALPTPTQVTEEAGSNPVQFTAAPTQQTLEAGAMVVTTVVTNNDGTFYTTSSTIYPTTVLATPSLIIPTSRGSSTVTDSPEPQSLASGPENTNPSNMSKGAVAGLAIGTFLAGVILAFLITWLGFKRRERKFIQKTCPSGYPIYADSSPELVMLQKSAAAGGAAGPYVQVSQTQQMRTPVPVPARSALAAATGGDLLAGIVAPSASEHEVQNRLTSLFANLQRHIDTFYRDVHASITPSMASDLAEFGQDVDVYALMQSCSRPTAVLKHALVAYVLGITAPPGDSGNSSNTNSSGVQSLWPHDLSALLSLHSPNPPPTSYRADLAPALSLHRRLTIHLYTSLSRSPLSQSPYPTQRASTASSLSLSRATSSIIREAAEHFSLTFFPWADPALLDSEREGDLGRLLGEVLETRVWMAGLEGEWGFEWEEAGRGVVVVRPKVGVRERGREGWRGVVGQSVEAV